MNKSLSLDLSSEERGEKGKKTERNN